MQSGMYFWVDELFLQYLSVSYSDRFYRAFQDSILFSQCFRQSRELGQVVYWMMGEWENQCAGSWVIVSKSFWLLVA